MARSTAATADPYSVAEVARKYGRSEERVRQAADAGILPCIVEVRGRRRIRTFPREAIDRLGQWPQAKPGRRLSSDDVVDEVRELRAENVRLQGELSSERTGRALAEQRIAQLAEVVERQAKALRALVDGGARVAEEAATFLEGARE